MSDGPGETLLRRETKYSGRVLSVHLDQVRLADGATTWHEVVVHPGSVAVVALDGTGRVLLVRQYRHPAGQELAELPAGRIDPGESPRQAAARELGEEAGLAAASLLPLLGFYTAPGYSGEMVHLFLATGLEPCAAHPDQDERLVPLWVDLAEAQQMCLDGRIADGKTIAGLLAYGHRWSRT